MCIRDSEDGAGLGVLENPGAALPHMFCDSHSASLLHRLQPFEDASGAHPAADAHRYHPITRLAPPHFIQKRGGELRAGAAERMPERDCSPVDIQTFRIDWQ